MEDIKSSKSSNQPSSKTEPNDTDSDIDNPTMNTSISEELSLDQEFKLLVKSTCDSDSDIDADILLGDEFETSTIRRSFANLRSKVKRRPSGSPSILAKKDTSPGRLSATASPAPPQTPAAKPSLRSTFLRKRRTHPEEEKECKSKPKIVTGKKEAEIESGVEMMEDMIPATVLSADNSPETQDSDKSQMGLRDKRAEKKLDLPIEGIADLRPSSPLEPALGIPKQSQISPKSGDVPYGPKPSIVWRLCLPYAMLLVLLFLVLLSPLPDFIRGAISCTLTMTICHLAYGQIQEVIMLKLTANGPEKKTFQIPDYRQMTVCQIPVVEEHQTVKTYTGWMNEIYNYDPANFHISMTKSVFVKLDGSSLRISNTLARVPKRQMWNEVPVDKKTITFTRHRTFNLLNCRIEMLPRGLARKRYFSKKYPIQLIVKNDDQNEVTFTYLNIPKDRPENIKIAQEKQPADAKLSKATAPMDWKDTNTLAPCGSKGSHQSSAESNDDRSSDRSGFVDLEAEMDFGATVMTADLRCLQDNSDTLTDLKDVSFPCGDETRLLLFARGDREKEDWYRRFHAASIGAVTDQDLHLPNIVMISDSEIQAAAKAAAMLPETTKAKDSPKTDNRKNSDSTISDKLEKSEKSEKTIETASIATTGGSPEVESVDNQKRDSQTSVESSFEGLLISSCAAGNPAEYIRFMARYQNVCSNKAIPVFKPPVTLSDASRRGRREKRQEDELWKGIDQSLYLGPSGSVVWANVLVGRVLFSCLNDSILLSKIQDFLQKKLSAIRLPGFMEDVSISQIHLGDTPPIIHRVSQPVLDERGTWIDADLTYEGLLHMTITTKLNLMRLKRQHRSRSSAPSASEPTGGSPSEDAAANAEQMLGESLGGAIYDSNAESSGASSSESDSPIMGTVDPNTDSQQIFNSNPGNARRIFKIVDRITASNIFQYATEISYVQRAMENMSTNITLRVELKGLVSRIAINIPPPPSDRIWLSFRGPPRLWISAKPAVGDHTFDWSIVTNVIESKLCDEVYKYLVYPNMIDVIVPFLGQSTYKE